MKKRRRYCGTVRLWQPAAMSVLTILTASGIISFGIQKGVINWETAKVMSKAVVALSSGITVLHYCIAAPSKKWIIVESVFLGCLSLILISETLFGGKANWNPSAGMIACVFGCLIGAFWTILKHPKRAGRATR